MPLTFWSVIVQTSKIAYRALTKTLREEVEMSQEAARIRYADQEKSNEIFTKQPETVSLPEAKQILNVKRLESADDIENQFRHLFESNKKENGGTLYLQSKIYRAKQRLDEELKFLNKGDVNVERHVKNARSSNSVNKFT